MNDRGQYKPLTLDELKEKADKLSRGETVWRTLASCAITMVVILLAIVGWLALALNEHDTAIERRNCRDAVFATWADGVARVIDASANDDEDRVREMNQALSRLGPLQMKYQECIVNNQ